MAQEVYVCVCERGRFINRRGYTQVEGFITVRI